MRGLWMRLRIPFAIIVLLVITLAMARIFSGPEDTWIKNEHGEWVKHGQPSGPPPAQDYKEPLAYKVFPFVFLIAFAAPLLFFGKHKPHNRLNFNTAARDIKFYGYFSTSLFLIGVLTVAGLTLELVLGAISRGTNAWGYQELIFVVSLAGFAGLCIVLSIQFFALKRNSNDHYQIEKSFREMMEKLENNPRG